MVQALSKFIEISRDITERKKREEEITQRLEGMVEERTRELKETHQKLLHQDKMASLGKLSASVVHEINNPISGILNLTLLIKRMLQEDALGLREIDQFKQYLDLMEAPMSRTKILGIDRSTLYSKTKPRRFANPLDRLAKT
jgi:two-component system NtrC family sensor kinase